MNKVIKSVFMVAVLAVPTFVKAADSNTGTLTVAGTVEGTITLTVDSTGAGTFTNAGAAASTDVGTISKYSAATGGFTKTLTGATSWKLASSIGVRVEKANVTSSAFTLNARLTTAPPTGVVWNVNTFNITAAPAAIALTAAGVYGPGITYPWTITINDDVVDVNTLNNTIEFSAVSG